MVFYFSATGNSKTIAEYVAREFNTNLVDINQALKEENYRYKLHNKDEILYFIFPVYYYTAPHQVLRFVEQLIIDSEDHDLKSDEIKVCVIATCGSKSGKAKMALKKALKCKGLQLAGFYQLVMPDFYTPLVTPPLPEEQTMILRRAKKELMGIFEDIKFNFRVSYDMTLVDLLLGTIGETLYKNGRPTKKFYATDSCISCGHCSKVCIDQIISVKGFEKPVWTRDRCSHCMACVNLCPQLAIEYGKKTKGKGRYYTNTLEK